MLTMTSYCIKKRQVTFYTKRWEALTYPRNFEQSQLGQLSSVRVAPLSKIVKSKEKKKKCNVFFLRNL